MLPFSLIYHISIHLHFCGSDRSSYKYLKFFPTIRENRGVYF